MLGYQPWRCMKHNLIADVLKRRWFRKIVWENFVGNNLRLFYVRIVKGLKSNIFMCKLWVWVILIILFTWLLCDNSNSLMYEPWKGQSRTLSHANCVILHLMLVFTVIIVTWMLWRHLQFCNYCLSKGSFLLRSNNLQHF